MMDRLLPVAQRMREAREKVAASASRIREAGAAAGGFEGELISRVAASALDFPVCAVDGGLLADRMVGTDILVRRAVAACFFYRNGRLESVKHHPKKFTDTEVDFRMGLDEHEAIVFRSIFRLRGELDTAIGALDAFRPGYLLLDGSVVPLGSDRPADGSALAADYEGLLEAYKALFEKCESFGCQLVGVIKDSRGKRLAEALGTGADVPDAILADALLSEGERTFAMGYSASPSKHPILKSLGDWGQKARLFYLKPSNSDIPLRIEFMQSKKTAGEIASDVLSLSSISRAFAYPAALIEADMCAALQPLEMEKIKKSLFALSGGASRPLRRAERPFR